MSRMHKCLGENCNKNITWRFALCSNCEKIYGSSMKNDWPAWLSFLWKATLKERRDNDKIRKFEQSGVNGFLDDIDNNDSHNYIVI